MATQLTRDQALAEKTRCIRHIWIGVTWVVIAALVVGIALYLGKANVAVYVITGLLAVAGIGEFGLGLHGYLQQPTSKLFWLNAVVVTLLWGAILVLVNLTSQNAFKRADLNQKEVYTLSDISLETVSGLPRKVHITYYLTEQALPRTTKYSSLRQDVEDLLSEYKIASNGELTFEVVDPVRGDDEVTADEKKTLEAKEGVSTITERISLGQGGAADKTKTYHFVSSLIVTYAEKRTVINGLREIGSLEYELTRKLAALSSSKLPQVGFYIPGDGSLDVSAPMGYSTLKAELSQFADVRAIEIGGEPDAEKAPKTMYEVPEDIDVLFVVAPKKCDQKAAFAIDQFIMRGGRVVFCLESHHYEQGFGGPMRRSAPQMVRTSSGMEDQLKSYGVRQTGSYIFEMHNVFKQAELKERRVGMNVFIEEVMVPYPLVVHSSIKHHNPNFAVVNAFDGLVCILASPLEAAGPAKVEEGSDETPEISFRYLVKSTARSWEVNLPSPQSLWKDHIDAGREAEFKLRKSNPDGKSSIYVALLEGEFKSFFSAGKQLPEWKDVAPRWKKLKRDAIKKARDEKRKKEAAEKKKKEEKNKKKPEDDKKQPEDDKKQPEDDKKQPEDDKKKPEDDKKKPEDDKKKGDEKKDDEKKGDEKKGDEKKDDEPEIEVKNPEPASRIDGTSGRNRIVVIGDSDMLRNWGMTFRSSADVDNNNRLFIRSLVEWLAASDELADLQAKGSSHQPLDVDRLEKPRVKLVATAAMLGISPLLVLIPSIAAVATSCDAGYQPAAGAARRSAGLAAEGS